ncbi:MAG: ABC transporter substrate-binding protein [Caldicoprobacterales bacterium]|jgi:multiple sugar transport system substrate-binding protein
MKKVKVLALLLALALILGIFVSGCTPKTEDPGKDNGDVTQNGDETPDDENGDEGTDEESDVTQSKYYGYEYPEGETIMLWSQNFGEVWVNHFSEQVHQYNLEGRGYTVVEEFVAGAAWDERMNAARASQTAPDAYIQSYNHIPAGIRNGYYVPVDDHLPAEVLDRMVEKIREMVTFDGKTYAIPILAEPSQVLFYRKDILEAAGYTEPPKTWDELIEMAVELKTDEMYGIGVPYWGGEIGWSTWGMQYGNVGHGPLTDDWDEPWIDDGYREFLEFWKKLYESGAVPEQPLSAYVDIKPMGQGDYVFQICGSWGAAFLINDYPDMWPNVGMAVMPTNDGNQDKTTATIGGWVYVLDAKAQNTEGVADYFTWLLDEAHPERLGEYYIGEQFSKAATFTNVAQWVESQAPDDTDYVAVINRIASYGQPEAAYPWEVSMAIDRMVENVAMGYETIDKAMEMAREEIAQAIEDFELPGTNPRK